MGWCSATLIFDSVVAGLLGDKDKKEVIKDLIEALENEDWDCQCSSDYFNHPIVKECFIELDPEWEEYYKESEEE